jgi:hypothetical protein
MVKRVFVLAIILVVAQAPISRAWNIFPNLGDERAGTASMQFLKLGAGAKAAAMGNSMSADPDGAFGLYWNPATLVWVGKAEVAVSHKAWVVDVNYDFLGYSMKLGEDAAIGASALFLGTDKMNVTDEYHPFGTGETFGFSDIAFGLSFAQRLTDYFSFGATAKYAQESIDDLKMRGFLLDLGTYYQTNFHGTCFAVTLTNFGQQVKPDGDYTYTNPSGEEIPKTYQSFSPPTVFRIGVTADLLNGGSGKWRASLQLDHPTDNAEAFVFGTEYGINDMLFLRGGYKTNSDVQHFSLGAGFKLNIGAMEGELDYAFSFVGDLGNSNLFSFRWGF